MELEMETGYSVIWASDLQKFFNEITGQHWNYAEGMDYPSQNTMSKCTVPDMEFSELLDGDENWVPDFSWQRWFDGGEFYNDPHYSGSVPSEDHVLQWLYENDFIPAGKYIVEVWW